VLFSTSEDGYPWAVRELRDAFGRDLGIERLGPDAGLLTAPGPAVDQVCDTCFRRPIAFVRHLTVERDRVLGAEAGDLELVTAAAVRMVTRDLPSGAVAVQAWVSGAPKMTYSAGALAGRITAELDAAGYAVARSGQDHVVSCCITTKGVSLGLNRRDLSLADWPGGRVRLGKGRGQVSRAEFKLEELFQVFPLDLPTKGRALDLGAAPGGWTRIMRQRGLAVWAIDPGDMAPSLLADPDVHHVRTTAGEFFRSTDDLFDLAVNDMRMDPEMSCGVMVDAAHRLRPGAYMVVTLKTGMNQPVAALRRSLALLRSHYEILFARQLHHNRHELTVAARRLG
jgi:23S rRNA (cytidine2498-2'-O)-methyltransferase